MGIKLLGYNDVKLDSFVKLPPGGYVCKILDATVAENPYTGRDQLLAYVDIAEGPFAGHFKRAFDDKKTKDGNAHWSNNAVLARYITDPNTNYVTKALKAFLEAVAASNADFKIDPNNFELKSLIGKLCGFTFGEREYESAGRIFLTTEIRFALPVDRIRAGDFNLPPVKELSRSADDSVPF